MIEKLTPNQAANDVLEEYCVSSIEKLNLFDIADGESLIIEEKELDNYLGKIIFYPDCGIITINKNIKEFGQKRFTLAHEFGHFFLERNQQRFNKYSCSDTDINIYKSNKIAESNANSFAAELLMPKKFFKDFTDNKPLSLRLIFDISNYFNVSLTAASIRYAEEGKYPVAVIMCNQKGVLWSHFSLHFPLKFLPVGYNLRSESNACAFFSRGIKKQTEEIVLARTWFADDFNCRDDMYLIEQNLYFTNYNQVLTLLWECKL